MAENAFFVAQIGGLECKFIIFVSDCYNGPIQFSILPLLELNSFEATSRTNVLSIFSTTQIHSRTTKSFKLLPEGGTNKKWLWLEQLLPTPEVRGSSHRQKIMFFFQNNLVISKNGTQRTQKNKSLHTFNKY